MNSSWTCNACVDAPLFRCRLECTIVEWCSEICPPWQFRTASKGDHIVEWDPATRKDDSNPGWGPAACKLTDPEGANLSGNWYDGGVESIPRKQCRRTHNPGDRFTWTRPDGKVFSMWLRKYTSTGVLATEVTKADLNEMSWTSRITRRGKRSFFASVALFCFCFFVVVDCLFRCLLCFVYFHRGKGKTKRAGCSRQ